MDQAQSKVGHEYIENAIMSKSSSNAPDGPPAEAFVEDSALVNPSGHVQELKRNFSPLTLAGLALSLGCVWPSVGTTIITSLPNGGPPGVLYEYTLVCLLYLPVTASLAELASAIPSSAGVYHWASVTPGKRWGRVTGFFAGFWNYGQWVCAGATVAAILGNIVIQMFALTHPDFVAKAWHVFVVYLILTWGCCILVCFLNKAMPAINTFSVFFLLIGWIVTIIVVMVIPSLSGGKGFRSTAAVWTNWQADIGYPSGFVFVAGMLNGAYSVGSPDVASHIAEEVHDAERAVPRAMAFQMTIGTLTGLIYLICIMYAINDYDALFKSPFPIAEIYQQATGSTAGAIGLLCFIFISLFVGLIDVYITVGRTFWALARDGATPYSVYFHKVHPTLDVPINATLFSAFLVTLLGCLYIGSTTAFNAFTSSFILMSTASYTAAILPHLLTGRKNIILGPFQMSRWTGVVVNFIACAYMIVWFVIYCFPYYLPTSATSMNYSSVIWSGFTIFVAFWWFFRAQHGYRGPQAMGGIHQEPDLDPEPARRMSAERRLSA